MRGSLLTAIVSASCKVNKPEVESANTCVEAALSNHVVKTRNVNPRILPSPPVTILVYFVAYNRFDIIPPILLFSLIRKMVIVNQSGEDRRDKDKAGPVDTGPALDITSS
jgi:hypothetical protein